jgi:hypothetical protein
MKNMKDDAEELEWKSWELLPHLLSFVTDDAGDYLSIHADLNGINSLIDALNELKDQLVKNDCPHTHLSPGRGYGPYLTTSKLESQEMEVHVVKHVKIYGWNDEWAVRSGLRPPTPPKQDRGWRPQGVPCNPRKPQ